MIITFKYDTPKEEIENLSKELTNQGFGINYLPGEKLNIMGIVGDTSKVDIKRIKAIDWVKDVTRIQAPYKLANRMFHQEDTIVDVGDIKIGGNKIVVIAGPCSVEGQEILDEIAVDVAKSGAVMLRGGAYKPRSSPYAFQGMQTKGIECLTNSSNKTGLPIVSELMSIDKINEFVKYVDVIQIGARNMQNFDLLKVVGKTKKPILLKRGLANTIEEWIMSAEYIMAEGNPNVILCERGIRTFEKYTRNTLDLTVIPIIKERTHLPIIIDPSHATGDYKYVEAVSLAAIAAGADGLMIEVHNNPECAFSDGDQSLKPERFDTLMNKARAIAKVVGREI